MPINVLVLINEVIVRLRWLIEAVVSTSCIRTCQLINQSIKFISYTWSIATQ